MARRRAVCAAVCTAGAVSAQPEPFRPPGGAATRTGRRFGRTSSAGARGSRSCASASSLPDGDFLDLAWNLDATGPLVLVLHGLEGSLRSHYAAGLIDSLHRAGYAVAFMHFRQLQRRANRLPRSYHSGDTQTCSAWSST